MKRPEALGVAVWAALALYLAALALPLLATGHLLVGAAFLASSGACAIACACLYRRILRS